MASTEAQAKNAPHQEPRLRGVFCPSITPLREDGSIDYAAWGRHLDRLVAAGIDGVLIFGSNGEFFSIGEREKLEAIDRVAEHLGGRTPLLVGTGSTRLDETLRLSERAHRAGATAAVVLPPYYFPPSDAAAFHHFATLAERSPLPLVIYNFPGTTGVSLSPALVARLAGRYPSIVGLKDTVDTASHTRQLVREVSRVRGGFSVLSGFDEYYVPNRIAGGDGVLCGLTNIAPGLFAGLHAAYEAGDFGAMVEAASRIDALMEIYEVGDSMIAAVKEAVRLVEDGITTRQRGPAIALAAEESERIARILRGAGIEVTAA